MDETQAWDAPDGARIFYRYWRAPRPRGVIVLLHGVASNSTRWWEFTAETSLKSSWDLVRIDRRGQGQSIWRGRLGPAEWCDDIAGILDSHGHSRAIVGGHCLGANIAVEFASRYPGRTTGLVLIEPMPRDSLTGAMRTTARIRGLLHVLAAGARLFNSAGLYRRRLRPLDLERLDRATRAADGKVDDGALALFASPLLDLTSTPSGSYFRDLLAVTAPMPPLAAIRASTLALVSRQSTFTDPPATRRALETMPHATLVEVEARHWIPTEQPRAMREAIEAWVERSFPAA
jgi:pimeloyl-ACP methyl ester carboxylesterase